MTLSLIEGVGDAWAIGLGIVATIVAAVIAGFRLLYRDGRKAQDQLLKAEQERIEELKRYRDTLEDLLKRKDHESGNGD